VAWCAGFGRLGGVGGPLVGGILIGAGLAVTQIFLVLAGVAVLGLLLVPTRHRHDLHAIRIEPTDRVAVAAAETSGTP
jgi:MFS transporter, AAHS family, benzoate transport protein